MLNALRMVLSGEIYLPPGIVTATDTKTIRKPTGTHPAISPSDLRAHLTSRQWEVLSFLARGLTNAQIADGMKLKETTVRVYVSAILDRLNLSNRTQAALVAAQALNGESVSDLVAHVSDGTADP